MLRIAVPNKGSLAESAAAMLREAGYAVRSDSKQLHLQDHVNGVEFFYLRPRDIAVYVGSGALDVGVTGRDLLVDSATPAVEVMPLGFGHSTFRFAAPPAAVTDLAGVAGRRVATSYDGLVSAYLAGRGVQADVVRLDGAVESAVQLGVADVIADVVETGTTLRGAGLEVFGEPLLRSEAVLVRGPHEGTEGTGGAEATGEAEGTGGTLSGLDVLVRRLQGVLVARRYVMMDYDVPRSLAERACEVTPGLESPTVSPLANPDWVAVRSMVPRDSTNRVMDELYDIGARAILVTTIHACRI